MMLVDSNLLIYASKPNYEVVNRFLDEQLPYYASISAIEMLGYHAITTVEASNLDVLLINLAVIPLTDPIIDRAIVVRNSYRMSLGDSIIAATALIHQLTLATHNVRDFARIPGLTIVDPLTVESFPTP